MIAPTTVQRAVFLFLLILSCSAAYADPVPKYNIKAALDIDAKTLTAVQTVTYTNPSSSPLNEIYFYIYPNREYTDAEKAFMLRFSAYFKVNPYPEGFDSGGISIHSVKSGGSDVVFNIAGKDRTLLKVDLPSPLGPGSSVTLTLDYSVRIPHAYGRFGWHEDMVRLSRWYPILCTRDDNGWRLNPSYPFHRPFHSDAADYSVKLTVPEGQVVVHTGISENEKNNGGTKTLTIATPFPVREFTAAMSPHYQVMEETVDGITFKSFYLPGDQYHARAALKNSQDLFAFYTERFGKYPYPEFSIAPVHLGYGGEQMSNLIFIDTRVYKLPRFLMRYFDFLISHEAGHQWFYNIVGIDEFSEMWLEEGIHSYFISEYLEQKYGPNASVVEHPQWAEKWSWIFPELTFKRTRDVRYKIMSRIKRYDRPAVGKLSSFQEPSSIFSVTYGKGSRIMEMFRRQMIGDETDDTRFRDVFRQMFVKYRFKNISLKGFIELCRTASLQRDLPLYGKVDEFFQQWLYTGKKLDFSVEGVDGNTVTLRNRGGIVMPVPIRIVFKGGAVMAAWWDGEKRVDEYNTNVHDVIVKVIIDPNNEFLDIDRTNNYWPRQVQVKPVPIYWPLYDYSAFQPEDAYRVIFGPELISGGLGVKASVQKVYDQIFYAATGYEFGEDFHISRAGYELKNVLNTQTVLGFEIANRTDHDGGEEDLVTGKAYIRRELWPAKYGVTDINDHITLYIIRNRGIDGSLSLAEREDDRNLSYLRRDEAIAGANLHLGRSGPMPDPRQGYNTDVILENSGHFFNATQTFTRGSIDTSIYQPVTAQTQLAFRAKVGLGYPNDKNLFQLGGWDGLRGFDRKTVRGANALLGSVEYRFPLIKKVNLAFLDNIIGLEAVSGVVFADVGQSWFSSLPESDLKKDAGGGLRFHVTLGSFLEKVIVRADVAQAINEDDEDDPYFWFGINHAF